MSNFVTDLTNLPFPKTNLTPLASGADPTKFVVSDDWNAVCQAALDLRGFVRTGLVPGSYVNVSLTVDADGRITAVSSGSTGVANGVYGDVTVSGGGTTWTVTHVGGLATVATTGSAADLSGTLSAARLPAFSGDVSTSAGSAVTAIGAHKVTNAMLAQGAATTLVGNNTGSTADRADLTVAQVIAMLGIRLGDFGDGSDGAATMDGSTAVTGCNRSGSTYTAQRPCFFSTMNISAGVTFKPDGWPIYVKGSCQIDGNMNVNGGAAAGTVNGTLAVTGTRALPVNLSLGTNSSAAPQVFVASSAANGGASIGGAGSTGGSATGGVRGRGGGGGAGGNNNPFTEQGAAGNNSPTVALAVATDGDIRVKRLAIEGRNYVANPFTLGTSGAVGGAGGSGTTGGGAGAAAAWLVLCAPVITGTGAIEAKGGAGGSGSPGGAGIGGAGGGGGGAGGLIVLVTVPGNVSPTVTVTGGAAGLGGAGGSGGAGSGGSGAAGGDGYALVL